MNTYGKFLIKLCGVYCALSASMLFGMYTMQTYKLAKQYGLMRKGLIASSDMEPKTALVPTDPQTMKELGLCPLFTQQESFQLDPILIKEMEQDLRSQGVKENDIKQQLVGLGAAPSPKYHIFKANGFDASFEEKSVPLDVPCVVPLGVFNNGSRELLQLKSLNQFELAEKTTLSPALCGGHALNNACLIRDYAETGEIKYLTYLHNLNDAANFLLNLKIDDWINVEVVKENLEAMSKKYNINVANISAVSTVSLFDSQLNTTPEFSLFNAVEFEYVQKLKTKLQQGLKKNNFIHVIIIGNEEVAETHGHYFAFAIIKLYNKIQYVVLDTLPNIYHLQEGSHERNRLMYLIYNIEHGRASAPLHNVRMRPEFMQSLGAHNQESLLEKQLIDERMEEIDIFKDHIAQLNNFSKLLTRFGIKNQLSKESKENLLVYRAIIQEMENVFGQEIVYPVLKHLIVKKLSEI